MRSNDLTAGVTCCARVVVLAVALAACSLELKVPLRPADAASDQDAYLFEEAEVDALGDGDGAEDMPDAASACPSPQVACDGRCLDISNDPLNCGRCGGACPSGDHAVAACAGGVCGLTCSAGYADCRGGAADGCETSTRSAAEHCGACGHACEAGRVCAGGECAAPCPGDAPDLCGTLCTNLLSDARNCGACGRACSLAHGTAACVGGSCAIASCETGFADCDREARNGCEANVLTSVAACGACGSSCSGAGGTPICARGSCRIACDPDVGDCNADPADGCETSLRTPAHCGSCARSCAPPNAVGGCAAGACAVTSCNGGFADCDGDGANGCETDTASSTAHCGGCGRSCGAGRVCSAGACATVCAAPTVACRGSCVATSSDVTNCGTCGAVCPPPLNASAVCASGRCGGACNAGFGDCNGSMSDGCEVNLATHASNCGACGALCAPPAGGSAVCSAARCDYLCPSGQLNCGGACRAVATDVTHCGACSASCPARANGAAVCASGTCSFTCDAGFADCDRDPSNGCEVNLDTGAAHCGRCGNACTLPNAVAACAAGGCRVARCAAGFADCDGAAASGCEVNLARDPRNCGGCALTPTEECNGRDDTCDGRIDEGCACTDRAIRSCYAGAEGTMGVGRCRGGTQTCAAGAWLACRGEVVPEGETCNGVDDDCNGRTDDLPDVTCGVGECRRTVSACVGGRPNVCVPGSPAPELCDGRDSNCNGVADDGCRRAHLELSPSVQLECPGGGWYLEYYRWDSGAPVRASTRGTPMDFVIPPPFSTRGTLGFSAWCPTAVGGSAWRNWTRWTGQPSRSAGVASISLDGVELAVSEALVCNYFPSCPYGRADYWTSPRVPLEASLHGRCDASPPMCPVWCADSSCR